MRKIGIKERKRQVSDLAETEGYLEEKKIKR